MNQELKFHVFETKETKITTKLVGLQALLLQIKEGDAYTPFIEAIRKAGKGSKPYGAIKSGRECVVWNATYNDGKTVEDIKDMTGFLYMDIDNLNEEQIPTIKQQLIALPYVKAAWRSIGGKGVGCLAYCEQVNKDNFKAVWNQISATLLFNFDGATNSLNRLNFISYDPDVLINESVTSFAFNALESNTSTTGVHVKVNYVPSENNNEKASHRNIEIPKLKVYNGMMPYEYNRELKYKTTFSDDVFNGQRYTKFEDGIEIHRINMFAPTPRGRRNIHLFAMTANLFLLNPNADQHNLLHEVYKLNNRLEEPLEAKEVQGIYLKCYKRFLAGDLYAKGKMQKMVLNPKLPWTPSTRRGAINEGYGEMKREQNEKIIREAMEKFTSEGISFKQKDIIHETGLSRSTVQRYYKRLKCNTIGD